MCPQPVLVDSDETSRSEHAAKWFIIFHQPHDFPEIAGDIPYNHHHLEEIGRVFGRENNLTPVFQSYFGPVHVWTHQPTHRSSEVVLGGLCWGEKTHTDPYPFGMTGRCWKGW